jgi:hypothetical protein
MGMLDHRASTGVDTPLAATAMILVDGGVTAVFVACDVFAIPTDVARQACAQ